jgi:hypothetical protein
MPLAKRDACEASDLYNYTSWRERGLGEFEAEGAAFRSHPARGALAATRSAVAAVPRPLQFLPALH